MKKNTLLLACFALTCISNYSFGNGGGDPLRPDKAGRIATLVINANVTVVLVNSEKATLTMTGGNYISKFITFKNAGDTLVINSTRNKNLKGAGIIYVPATQIQNVLINNEASVSSLYALQAQKLDVTVNGECQLSISNIGKVNLITTDEYILEQSTFVRRHYPANTVWMKKN